jgi:DNA invertase Pin-like site-specific DNA recombinase
MKTAALYIRVSTKEQNTDSQLVPLQAYAQLRGFDETLVYIDEGISGAKDRRPYLNELMKDARLRRFDTLIGARFDRFARSTQHLLSALEEFRALGIDFISLGESIDTTTPMGTMVFTIVAAFAQFERSIIQERIRAGLELAKRKGKQLGRPKQIFDRDKVIELADQGLSARRIAKILHLSDRTVRRCLRGRGKIIKANFA